MPFQLPLEVVARDGYGNDWVQLQLFDNQSYEYIERFVDGTSLIDRGSWTYQSGKICLTSNEKTQRTSFSIQETKKSYKFKSECFEYHQAEHRLRYSQSKGPNAYLNDYVWMAKPVDR
jgi:hypothetical protein